MREHFEEVVRILKPYPNHVWDRELDISIISKSELKSALETDDLVKDSFSKNTLWMFLNPRPLLPYSLPKRVQKECKDLVSECPWLVSLMLEASRTTEYWGFMRHIAYSFGDVDFLGAADNKALDPGNCPLCGRSFLDVREIMSVKSTITLCSYCTYHVKEARDINEEIYSGTWLWKK